MAQKTDLRYGDLRESIQREKDRRIREYQANIAKTKSMRESRLFEGVAEPLRLVAQGDSWFDYPLPVPILDQSDVIAHLRRLPSMSPYVLSFVRAGYEDLFIARDRSIYPEIQIFGHSYDFAIPNGIPVNCVVQIGPWLKPGLDDRGWTDPVTARQIVRLLLKQFAKMLDGFEADKKKKFVHIRTQGTLTDNQWANELHPKPNGFAAITAKFVAALRATFHGRI